MIILTYRYEVSHSIAAGCEDFIGIFQDAENIQRLIRDAMEHNKTLVFREANAQSTIFAKDESYAIFHKKPGKPGFCIRVERSGCHSFYAPWESELLKLVTPLIHTGS